MRYVLSTLMLSALIAGLFLLSPVHAGEAGLVGNWKVTLYEDGQEFTFWILKVANKGGITGQVVSLKKVPPSALKDFQLTDDVVRFKIILNNQVTFTFEGKLPPVSVHLPPPIEEISPEGRA